MIKHGISHAALALTAIISGEVICQKVLLYWPEIENSLAAKIQVFLLEHNWTLDTHRIGMMITIALFGFAWGATFKSFNDCK